MKVKVAVEFNNEVGIENGFESRAIDGWTSFWKRHLAEFFKGHGLTVRTDEIKVEIEL